jgi:dienelactone hydrolase
MVATTCQFRPSGWAQWPDSEDLSGEFARLLGAAQEGGSTVSECFLTASRIDPDDGDSWYREWSKTADASRQRGNSAFQLGHLRTAQSNWLRATNYYSTAVFDFDFADSRLQAGLASMRGCARRYLEHRTPVGEVVEIPWLNDYPLEGYFLPPSAASVQTPAVICIGEPGHRKEEYLYKTARYARDRGMSLLAVDLLGSDNGARFEGVVGRSDLEMSISYIMDYVAARDDVDARRIAILGDSSASSFVARAVALDQRFAAAVCDGGIWDLQERKFLATRLATRDVAAAAGLLGDTIARNLKCPILITVGEHGWIEAERLNALFEQLKMGQGDMQRDITLKLFTAAETAAAQGHSDNPTLANEFVFDWIADRLECGVGSNP